MVIVMALGGSTNAVLHLIAIARWVIIFLHVLSTWVDKSSLVVFFQVCRSAFDSWWFPEGQWPSSIPRRPQAQWQICHGGFA
jgi:hypothetical protein